MKDRILIDKNMIPYSFDILLGAEWFNFDVNYNQTQDLFTVTLSKDDNVLIYNEPVVYGVKLFSDVYEAGKIPAVDIIPLDESGQETAVTWENFNETVFLCVGDGDE